MTIKIKNKIKVFDYERWEFDRRKWIKENGSWKIDQRKRIMEDGS